MERSDLLRNIPQVEEMMHEDCIKRMENLFARGELLDFVREATDKVRRQILDGVLEDADKAGLKRRIAEDAVSSAEASLEMRKADGFRVLINASGIVIHTNLGRSLLCESAKRKMMEICDSYTNLEYDIRSGARGSRHCHVEEMITKITGAESAMVVNNNAAATLLTLSALAKGKEVVTSRGELVEIGGAFRIPEIMAQGGAILKEVGTTNRTRIDDYVKAFRQGETAAFLKVHRSNFRIVGFTEEASIGEIAEEAHRLGIPSIYDLGSGNMVDLTKWGIEEPSIPQLMQKGVDLVLFSGDKMLGGPQSGIIIGRKNLVDILKKHPLARALRVDKLTIAALTATISEYRYPGSALERIPTLSMITAVNERLRQRAKTLAKAIEKETPFRAKAVPVQDLVGAGSAPGHELAGWAVELTGDMSANDLEEKLRLNNPSIISRIEDGRVVLSVRTIRGYEEMEIVKALSR